MKVFKKVVVPVLAMSALAVSLVVPSLAYAADSKHDLSHIDKNLLKKLHNAGFSDAQISILTDEVLQDLKETIILRKLDNEIVERGEIYTDSKTGKKVKKVEYKKGEVTTRSTGNLDMDLSVDAWEVSSDRSGEKKFIIVADYNWDEVPLQRFTDALAVGWPDSTGWYIPTNEDYEVEQFYANDYYVNDESPYDREYRYNRTRTPADAKPNAGVGYEIDLPGVLTAIDFYGGLSQYVYVDEDKTGDTNIQAVYGHSVASITPSFDVTPAGFTIEPGVSIIEEYAMTTLRDW